MRVVVGVVDAERGVLHAQAVEQEEANVGPDRIMRGPCAQLADDKGMFAVAMHGTVLPVTEAELKEALAVGFIVLEAHERQCADITFGDFAIG